MSTIATRGALCSSNTGATPMLIEKHGWCEIQAEMTNKEIKHYFLNVETEVYLLLL